MGKKYVLISGLLCGALILFSAPKLVDHLRIEGYVKDLHSFDKSVREKAIQELAAYGTEVIPRLLAELETCPSVNDEECKKFNRNPENGKTRAYEMGFIRTLVLIGEESIPYLFERLTVNDKNLESVAYCSVMWIYAEVAKFETYEYFKNGGGFIFELTNAAYREDSNRQIIFYIRSAGWDIVQTTYTFDEGELGIKEVNLDIKYLLSSITKFNSFLTPPGFMSDALNSEHQKIEVKSGLVIESAKTALMRLEEAEGVVDK